MEFAKRYFKYSNCHKLYANINSISNYRHFIDIKINFQLERLQLGYISTTTKQLFEELSDFYAENQNRDLSAMDLNAISGTVRCMGNNITKPISITKLHTICYYLIILAAGITITLKYTILIILVKTVCILAISYSN